MLIHNQHIIYQRQQTFNLVKASFFFSSSLHQHQKCKSINSSPHMSFIGTWRLSKVFRSLFWRIFHQKVIRYWQFVCNYLSSLIVFLLDFVLCMLSLYSMHDFSIERWKTPWREKVCLSWKSRVNLSESFVIIHFHLLLMLKLILMNPWSQYDAMKVHVCVYLGCLH
jgi:hypothetical protein